MERSVFDSMAENDQVHWWYVARRKILAELIRRMVDLPGKARILEIGCGTGHNFEMLGGLGELDALELDGKVRALATARLGREVGDARLPELTGVPDHSYDLIALLDVLEHVDDHQAALESIATKLAPGGKILVTVPAYQWMWSEHDVVNHHKRRYSKRTLRAVAEAAGLEVGRIGSFNSLLFPVAVAGRVVGKITGWSLNEDKVPPWPLNPLFEKIFALERHVVGRAPFPAGVSIFALLSTR